ncbi:MAG: general secretion pathway protein J [Gammaproteobacteria bacterium]
MKKPIPPALDGTQNAAVAYRRCCHLSARQEVHRGIVAPVHQRGFTLVEVIVGLVLLSVISTSLAGIVATVSRMSEAAQKRAHSAQDMRLVADLFERAFTGAVPLSSVISGKRHAHVHGTASAVTVVVDLPARFTAGGLYEVTFAAMQSGTDRKLMMTRRLIHPDVMRSRGNSIRYLRAAPDDERVLLPDAKVRFGYFGRSTRLGEPHWADEWDGKRGLPLLIRANIETQGRPWPEIVARPQIRRPKFQTLRGSRPPSVQADDGAGDSLPEVLDQVPDQFPGSFPGQSQAPAAG